MLFLYNFLQWTVGIVLLPLIFILVGCTAKYRGRIFNRLGYGLDKLSSELDPSKKRIWIHALSVGEVSSSRALVKALRKGYPGFTILFSSTTRSGVEFAGRNLRGDVDAFVPFPLDLFFVARKFVEKLAPDIFILVETDFWPNFQHILERKGIPAVLVNGRISSDSLKKYQRFGFFFVPLFRSFSMISMQTSHDAGCMENLGIASEKVKTLGNLKYDAVIPDMEGGKRVITRKCLGIARDKTVWVAGSTHPGEEEIIFRAYARLAARHPSLYLVVAPRNADRGAPVGLLAKQMGLSWGKRTDNENHGSQVLVLDTMGELADVYRFCDMAFVGGSLAAEGGHNPLEPAVFGKPVFFGPFMDDFREISAELLKAGGAKMVSSEDELVIEIGKLLENTGAGEAMGRNGKDLVERHQGVTGKHVTMIANILEKEIRK